MAPDIVGIWLRCPAKVGSAVIASEAKQSRLTCACASGGDCFVARRSGLPDLRMNSADLG